MRALMVLLIGVLTTGSYSQDTKVSNYIEGGKLALEFVKLFKSSNDGTTKSGKEDCKKLGRSDIFYENKRQTVIKIVLTDKENQSSRQEAIIQPGKRESILSIPAKVYVCEVIDQGIMSVIRKGDIKLSPCENPTILIE